MAEIPQNLRFLLFGRGARWHAISSFVLDCLGLVCLVLGIIGAAGNNALGLGATNWLLLAIALFMWGFWAWICAYTAAKEG
jgi:hypothetical protein